MQVIGLFVSALQSSNITYNTQAGDADGRLYLWIAIAVALLALALAFVLARLVIAADAGTPQMQVISNAIREGAEAFLKRQYRTIAALAVGGMIVIVVVFLEARATRRSIARGRLDEG